MFRTFLDHILFTFGFIMYITDGGNLVSVHDRKTAKFLSTFIRNIEWKKPPWDRSGVWTGGIF